MFFRIIVLTVIIVSLGKATDAQTSLESPEGLAFQAGQDGNPNTLWVANYNSDTVVELNLPFPPLGKPGAGVASAAIPAITTRYKGVGGPTRIALDSAGNLYVTLSKANAVEVYVNSNGTYNINNPIVLTEGLNRPLGIAVENVEHTLFVANNAPDPTTGKTILNIYQNFIPQVGMAPPNFTPVPINPAPGALWVGSGVLSSPALLIANGPSSGTSTIDAYNISNLPKLTLVTSPVYLPPPNTGPTGIAFSSAPQIGPLAISCLYSHNVVFNLTSNPSSVDCPTCEGVAADDTDGFLFTASASLGMAPFQSGGIQVYQYGFPTPTLVNTIVAYTNP